jgi:predicted transcriptional regulator
MTNKSSIRLNLEDSKKTALVLKALSSESRVKILRSIVRQPAIHSELAASLKIPLSTMTMHLKILEEAGLITVTPVPGTRGSQKRCGAAVDSITLDIMQSMPETNASDLLFREDMPIGNYFDYRVTAPCGIASERGYISHDDDPDGFSDPGRFAAQIIWLSLGYLEYRFPVKPLFTPGYRVERIEFLFEMCSETFCYNEDWRSDVSLWINGHEIGLIECPGDHGGRRGRLNPGWWPDYATQFGDLHHVTITNPGCAIDSQPAGRHTLSSLSMNAENGIRIRIGVKPDARYAGGFNLFGEKFGDFSHGIVMQAYGKRPAPQI